jgi:putative peptidoglycan lipid II flippase
LPYLILVCLAAITSAALQGFGSFGPPAFAPAVLNVCWIVGAVFVAPRIADDASSQAYVLAICILIGGLLQWLVQWPALHRDRFSRAAAYQTDRIQSAQPLDAGSVSQRLRKIQLGMIPTMLALTVTQLNTLSDSLVAWFLAAPKNGPQTISWLGNVAYPMQQGAAAAIYFGERLYQFPLGLIGIAAATVAFPLLSQDAARGDRAALSGDLSLGLRMVLLVAVPSAVGLVVLAEPIARLLFQHGEFTATDAARAARMIAVYGTAVWAYCALPVLVRGFYAVGDRITPLRIALAAVALNLTLDFTLIWPLGEAGLAASTAISAAVQAAALAIFFSRRRVPLLWQSVAATALRAIIGSAALAAVCLILLSVIPIADGIGNRCLRLVAPLAAGAVVYLSILAIIGRRDWRDLTARS